MNNIIKDEDRPSSYKEGHRTTNGRNLTRKLKLGTLRLPFSPLNVVAPIINVRGAVAW